MMAGVCTAVVAASQAHAVTGNWCGDDDYEIWIGTEEAVLGEHAYCRWEQPVRDGPSHIGDLHCRTTETLTTQTVEHPLRVALSMDNRGWLHMDYLDGSEAEVLRPCGY